MPDAHMGYGMPIGGVLATKGVVIPNAVGVDIGCGMCAVKTDLKGFVDDDLSKIRDRIKELVPVGFNHQKKMMSMYLMPPVSDSLPIVSSEYNNARKQLGTLGGGNHFIEIQKGSDGHTWIMIHSGSRNLGYKVAKYYNDIAVNLNEYWHSSVTKDQQLAFLPLGSKMANDYIAEMNYCTAFALANRSLMMKNVCKAFNNVTGLALEFDNYINIAHNYARMESHYGENVMVHRKGATSAREGELGIIPGSQGTKSYITEGLGNHESFMSCSHGAGRSMGRKAAQKNLDLDEEISKMECLGVLHDIKSEKDLDEAAGAYKDIDEVMENQKDLVKIKVELTPLAVIKG